MTLDGATGDGAMLAGVTGDAGVMMLMAETESARAAGSGGGIPANTEGSRAGEAVTS